jgi:hypothetical protein
MAQEQVVDKTSVHYLAEHIEALERKVRLMKQFINPETGTIDKSNMANLYQSSNDELGSIRDLIVKFL